MDLKEQNEVLIDLEIGGGGGSSEEEVVPLVNREEQIISSKARILLDRVWNDIVAYSIDVISGGGEDGKSNTVSNGGDLENGGEVEEKKSLLQGGGGGGGDTPSPLVVVAKKKENKKSKTKVAAPKPPRPPRGPSLDAADQKLIREFSELAMLKRARVERMRALKKMKAAKAASSNSNMYAMIITVMFCLVIIIQETKMLELSPYYLGSLVGSKKSGIVMQRQFTFKLPRLSSVSGSNESRKLDFSSVFPKQIRTRHWWTWLCVSESGGRTGNGAKS